MNGAIGCGGRSEAGGYDMPRSEHAQFRVACPCHFILHFVEADRKSGTLRVEKRYFTHRKAVLFSSKNGTLASSRLQHTDNHAITKQDRRIEKNPDILTP